jgi:hypothetical protein
MRNDEPTGKAVGAAARAASLSGARRKEISAKAIEARKELAKLPRATHGSPDKPLKIGGAELTCYVLEDGTRLITQEGFLSALGRARKAKGGHGASIDSGVDKMPSFLAANNLKPFISDELLESTTPVVFRTPSGAKAYGYRADLLPKVCNVYLLARDAAKDLPSQKHLIRSADLLMRGLAEVGIIALVDEATGYQRDRAKNALAEILEAFVAKELQPWVKTFPPEFYEQMFRLRGLPYPPEKAQYKPQYFGNLTNDIVYKRIAPGLLDELKQVAAKDEKKARLHQRLTTAVGHPRLREHLASVTTIMRLSKDYEDFAEKLDEIHPKLGTNLKLDI